jgi:hypothetical protein
MSLTNHGFDNKYMYRANTHETRDQHRHPPTDAHAPTSVHAFTHIRTKNTPVHEYISTGQKHVEAVKISYHKVTTCFIRPPSPHSHPPPPPHHHVHMHACTHIRPPSRLVMASLTSEKRAPNLINDIKFISFSFCRCSFRMCQLTKILNLFGRTSLHKRCRCLQRRC